MAVSLYPNLPNALTMMVSRANGIYADHGIYTDHGGEIAEITSFAGGGTTIRGITTGRIPVGIGAVPGAAQAFMAGAPVTLIGSSKGPGTVDVVTLADSDIETMMDLKGKTLGLSQPGGTATAMVILSIKRAGGRE